MPNHKSLYVHAEEWANRNIVHIKLTIGESKDSARAVGTVTMAVPFWQRFSKALELGLGVDFERGTCQHGCEHPSHLGEACTAAVFSIEGLPAICPCTDER